MSKWNNNKVRESKDEVLTIVDRRWKIIRYIQANPNQSAYKIAKEMGLFYDPVFNAIRELVFARVLNVSEAKDKRGDPIDVFSIPEVKE